MGDDVIYSFDSRYKCRCPYCGKVLYATGWIREYPTGVLDSEEINVDTIEEGEV